MKVHYCKTIYDEPPRDINPLLLQLYENKRVIVLVARDKQKERIDKLSIPNLVCIGWWELTMDIFNAAKLCTADAVIIVDIARVAEELHPVVEGVMKTLKICQSL